MDNPPPAETIAPPQARRLGDFIAANIEPILKGWEVFARSIWTQQGASSFILRDHAEDILRASVRDMQTRQTAREQSAKSKGHGEAGRASDVLDKASKIHAVGRVNSGFDLLQLAAEYRALRASVLRLWRESGPVTDLEALDDVTRFNEAIDQSLAEGISSFSGELDRSRDMFLGILSHDLRTPLNAMMLTAESLAETSSGESAELAAQIVTSGHAAAGMLADFVDFTSSRLGRAIPLTTTHVELGQLSQQVVAESIACFPRAQVEFTTQGDTVGQWDPNRLRQVVSNLLRNAVEHGQGTPIHLDINGEGEEVRLRVRNGGEPVPAEILPRIFEPMVQRCTEPRKPRPAGSLGLGLYIAREIAHAHGGSINVDSTTAHGTEFTLKLPRFCGTNSELESASGLPREVGILVGREKN